jgi:hypothetical protein
MTGPEHYRLAEVIVEDANNEQDNFPSDRYAQSMAEAQVHATLALAAATALTIGVDDSPTIREWAAVAGQAEVASS